MYALVLSVVIMSVLVFVFAALALWLAEKK